MSVAETMQSKETQDLLKRVAEIETRRYGETETVTFMPLFGMYTPSDTSITTEEQLEEFIGERKDMIANYERYIVDSYDFSFVGSNEWHDEQENRYRTRLTDYLTRHEHDYNSIETLCYLAEMKARYIDVDSFEIPNNASRSEAEQLVEEKAGIRTFTDLAENVYIILDTETTGFSKTEDDVIELGITDINGNVLYDGMFRPDKENSPEAESANHISNVELQDKPTILEEWEKIKAAVAGRKIATYNLDFDKNIMINAAVRHGIPKEKVEQLFENSVCIMQSYIKYTNGYRASKLQNALTENGIDVKQDHRAVSDCQATAQLIQTINEKIRENSHSERNENKSENENTYEVYQLQSGERLHGIRFESYEMNRGKVTFDDYDLVYSGNLNDIKGTAIEDKLNSLYFMLNMQRPDDFRGHSLSMSDVIVAKDGKEENAYYVDRTGFADMPEFILQKGWEKLTVAEKYEKISDNADIITAMNIAGDREKLTVEQAVEKYAPYIIFKRGERPEEEPDIEPELAEQKEKISVAIESSNDVTSFPSKNGKEQFRLVTPVQDNSRVDMIDDKTFDSRTEAQAYAESQGYAVMEYEDMIKTIGDNMTQRNLKFREMYANNPPKVVVEWSEHPDIKDGQTYGLYEFSSMMERLEEKWINERAKGNPDYEGYAKTKFMVKNIPFSESEIGDMICRQDIGDGDGSLANHIRLVAETEKQMAQEWHTPTDRQTEEFAQRRIDYTAPYIEWAVKYEERQHEEHIQNILYEMQENELVEEVSNSNSNSKNETEKEIQPSEEKPQEIKSANQKIGNTTYKFIPNKTYINTTATAALQIAKLLENNDVKFSGLIKGDKGTITVSKDDYGKVMSLVEQYQINLDKVKVRTLETAG